MAGFAAGGLLLLTGCGSSSPEPQQTFTEFTKAPVSPSPRPTPSVEPVAAPTRTAEMERADEVGAAAAATYFMELFAYVMHTGDHDEWDRIGIADCRFCANTTATAERIYGGGGRVVGRDVQLGVAEVLGQDPQLGVYAVLVPYSVASGLENDDAGVVIAELDAEEGALVLDVIYAAAGWTLVGGTQADQAQ